jgi:branched-chain amino acid transport system substrate-binding protein/urea transport system substrate-binding protein
MRGGLMLAAGLAAGLLGGVASGQEAPVKLGAVLPFSGGLELFGGQARLGIDLAVKEINDGGGIQGRPVEVIYEDNQTDPRTSVERATKLTRGDGVIAVLGPITSNARDAMLPTMERAKVPLLYATNYEGGACSRYVFAFNSVPNQELAELVPYLAENRGRKFFMFGADYVWPQKMFETAATLVAEAGGEVVGTEFTPWGVTEFAPVVRRIEESGADVLLFALPGADGITFIRQAEDFGLLEHVTVGFLGFSEDYLGAFGEGKAQDMWVTVPFAAADPSEGVQYFTGRLAEMAGPDVVASHYTMTHYNAVIAVAEALEGAETIDAEALVDGLEGLEIETPTGLLSIGAEDHHVTMEMLLAHTVGDGLEVVDRLGRIAPEAGCN